MYKKLNAIKVKMLYSFILGTFLLLTVFAAGGYAQVKEIKDDKISAVIEENLVMDKEVASHLIDISTVNGIVTLSGTVDNMLAKERAAEVARAVKGGWSVINRIIVEPVVRPDSEIKQDVKRALLTDPVTEPFEIDVKVEDRVVTLKGKVDAYEERRQIVHVVKEVKGIKDIKNTIGVNPAEERPDEEIKAEIERKLYRDPFVNGVFIEVSVDNGHVELTGSVGSAAEKFRALKDAWVSGVETVDNDDLKIEWWASDELRRSTPYVAMTDEEVKKAVREAFICDPRVEAFNLETNVNEKGEVVLSGIVDNLKAKNAAKQDALNTVGVWRVVNNIKVRPEDTFTDREIAENVRLSLNWNPVLEKYDIGVMVRNRRVNLNGTVYSNFEKEYAEEIASKVIGVAEVKNNIEVHYKWVWKANEDIKSDLEQTLYWNVYVDEKDVSIEVEEGKVILYDTVNNLLELREAVNCAFEAGAKDVQSRLKIKEFQEYFPLYHVPISSFVPF